MPASSSPRLGLSYGWSDGEGSWGPPLNVDLLALDVVVSPYLLSVTTTTPPGSPTAGDSYYVPTGGSGAWTGHVGSIASYQNGQWAFYATPKGLRTRVVDVAAFMFWNGTAWALEIPATAGATTIAISVTITGMPAAGAMYNSVIAIPLTLPANFQGTQVYDGTQATANTIVTVKKITGGTTVSTIGTITITPTGHQSFQLSTQAAVSFAAGDVLQCLFPAQDATLADVSIAILANRT